MIEQARAVSLSVPGKTFLVGEYLALDGGPSITLATAPCFEGTSSLFGPRSVSGIHESSPAGKFLKSLVPTETAMPEGFEFKDPHAGKGGLGASTAQFAMAYALSRGTEAVDWRELLSAYREFAWDGQGNPPSGADLVGQWNGGVTYFDARTMDVRKLTWSFDDMGFTLIRTGSKLATHEHLKGAIKAPFAELRAIAREAFLAFETSEGMRLIEAVQAYAHVLGQAGLTANATTDLLGEMRGHHHLFWAAKGCGAMGADVIVALHDRKRAGDIEAWATERGLETCGGVDDLSEGLVMEASFAESGS